MIQTKIMLFRKLDPKNWLFGGGWCQTGPAGLVDALNIEDLYIITWSVDEVTGDLITGLSFVIDSPVSQVQQDTSIL